MNIDILMDELLLSIQTTPKLYSFTDYPKLIKDGLIMEFGVYKGDSLRQIASSTDKIVYGFDSFEGLPEDWWFTRQGKNEWFLMPKGTFSCDIPIDLPNNVVLIKGLFKDTIPDFIKSSSEKVSFMHIDCDLYSSTKDVLNGFKNRFQDGSILVFDEFFEEVKRHECKAFAEFILETGYKWTCLGSHAIEKVAFQIME